MMVVDKNRNVIGQCGVKVKNKMNVIFKKEGKIFYLLVI